MNRILFKERELSYRLSTGDQRFEHVRGVLRMQLGDSFDVGVMNGPIGKATIQSMDREWMEIAVDWKQTPALPPPIWLVVGLCRPATVKKILRTVPSLGVRGIYFVGSEKSLGDYGGSRLWEKDGWHERLVEGVEQAFVDTFVPEVALLENVEQAVEKVPADAVRYSLDLFETEGPLAAALKEPAQGYCLAIGPERGWGPLDRQRQAALRFKRVGLGNRVMRVETAIVAALAQFISLEIG